MRCRRAGCLITATRRARTAEAVFKGGGRICPAIMHGQSLILYYEGVEMDAMKPRHGRPVRSMMMQKVGDRDKDMVSVKGIAFCVNANPMSDRQQMVIEWDEETSIENSEQRGCDETFLGEH